MFDKVNMHSSVAVYGQIENLVRFAISAGKLKAGDQLPSVRELSERLQVNPNTVAKAYRDLEVMGIVYTRRGMGVYVQKGVEAKCRDAVRSQIVRKLFESVCEAKAAGLSEKEVRSVVEKLFAADSQPYASDEALVRSVTRLL